MNSKGPGDRGFLVIHHFFLLPIRLSTLMNKLIKLATGKNLKNDFFPIKGTVSQGTINIAKANVFFYPY
ncbi:hypothetical protein [Cytobacillus firmus]|uniref:hypothetical protein n=1 Tax=Cytobacillus firmus TaxID=1399 RepID=UPI0018CDD0ED|nr:hypothetical protein [Cytobacillus firmus]